MNYCSVVECRAYHEYHKTGCHSTGTWRGLCLKWPDIRMNLLVLVVNAIMTGLPLGPNWWVVIVGPTMYKHEYGI